MFLQRKLNTTGRQNPGEIPDARLLDDFRMSQKHKYVEELFNRYAHLIFGVAMKYLKNEDDAKDAAMLIFEALPDKIAKHEITNFKNWLYSVVKNQCLMMLRQSSRQLKLKKNLSINQSGIMELTTGFHLHEKVELEYRIEKLNEALRFLKEEQRTCVEMMYLEQKSYVEISEETGYSMKKVKSYIQNGKRNLKLMLEKK